MAIERGQLVTFPNYKKPNVLTPIDLVGEIKKFQKAGDNVLSLVPQFTDHIDVNLNVNGPIRFLPISDTHLFSMLTDYDLFLKTLKYLEDQNTFTAVCGDFLEGANPDISSHIGEVMFSTTNQVMLGKRILKPLVESGKVLAVVGMYNGHEEWTEKMTISAIMFLVEGLTQPDGTPLQAIINGGDLELRFKNGNIHRVGLYHDAGGGGSDRINPVGNLRNQSVDEPLNVGVRSDSKIGGHWHHRGAYAEEIQTDIITGKESGTIYSSLATYKAITDKRPDRFLKSKGKKPNARPGFGMILNTGKVCGAWPTYGFDKLGHLYKGARYWDQSEKIGVTEELIQKIVSREEKIEIKFDRRNSRAQIPETDDVNVPLFDYFKWKVTSSLPIAVYTISHLRKGSTSGGGHEDEVKNIVSIVANNDHAFLLVLRHMLDPDVASSPDRLQILTSLAEILKPAHEKNSLLGLMLSAKSFRSKAWQKDLINDDETIKGVRPGDKLWKSLLPKTPLFTNNKVMNLELNGSGYLFQLLDELGRSGSSFNMFQGLLQMSRKSRLQFDVVMGGHMSGAGVMQTETTTYIAPGWYSLFDSFGKANATVAPKGGQGVILLPNQKAVFGASSPRQLEDIHTALTLKFGLTDKEKRNLMRRKEK